MWFNISFKLKQSCIKLILHWSVHFDSIVYFIYATVVKKEMLRDQHILRITLTVLV